MTATRSCCSSARRPRGPWAPALTNADLSERYLWGPANRSTLRAGSPWSHAERRFAGWHGRLGLDRQLGTVRDMAVYNSTTGVTSIAMHRVYGSFGNLVSQTNPSAGTVAAVDCLFGFTGRPFDTATGLQNNDNRWYDPSTQRWLSQDPDEFTAGDTNLYRYVGNSPANATDPSGLEALTAAKRERIEKNAREQLEKLVAKGKISRGEC